MRWLVLLSLSLGGVAHAVPAQGLAWDWSDQAPRRYYVDAEVQMPSFFWVMAERNKEARLVAFRTRSVLVCGQGERLNRRTWEVDCRIDQIGILGATLRGDKGLLGPILQEMDDKLTGSELQVRFREDGRVVNVDLEGVDKSDRRMSRTHEVMRLMMIRSLAGFDLQLPKNGVSQEGVWGQTQALLLTAATDVGSQGAAEVAHLVRESADDIVIIETAGRAMVVPGSDGEAGRNFFSTKLNAVGVFNVTNGMLTERVWSALGEPTASSALTEGGAGMSYVQRGRILHLPEGADVPDLGATEEVPLPDGRAESAIHVWTPWSGSGT